MLASTLYELVHHLERIVHSDGINTHVCSREKGGTSRLEHTGRSSASIAKVSRTLWSPRVVAILEQENIKITNGYRTIQLKLTKGNPTHQQDSSSPNLPSRFLRGVFLSELFNSGSVFVSSRTTSAKDPIRDTRSATSLLLLMVFIVQVGFSVASL